MSDGFAKSFCTKRRQEFAAKSPCNTTVNFEPLAVNSGEGWKRTCGSEEVTFELSNDVKSECRGPSKACKVTIKRNGVVSETKTYYSNGTYQYIKHGKDKKTKIMWADNTDGAELTLHYDESKEFSKGVGRLKLKDTDKDAKVDNALLSKDNIVQFCRGNTQALISAGAPAVASDGTTLEK